MPLWQKLKEGPVPAAARFCAEVGPGMYSDSAGAYESEDPGAPPAMPALDLAAQLQLGSGTPRGHNGPGPSSARSFGTTAKSGATPRGSQTARTAGSTQAFGAVRLPRPPAQPKANRCGCLAPPSAPRLAPPTPLLAVVTGWYWPPPVSG